jgi:hypothetical protein
MLLDATDLPGSGWKVSRTQTVRAGVIGDVDEVDLRARDLGYVSEWRSFVEKPISKRLVIKIAHWASQSDAEERLTAFGARFLEGMKVRGEGGVYKIVPGLTSNDGLTVPAAEFENTLGVKAGRNFKRAIGQLGERTFSITASGINAGWSWDEAVSVLDRQREKILQLRKS